MPLDCWTVHVKLAAVDVLPAASTARTLNVCDPAARPLYAVGLVQAEDDPLSSWHLNVTPCSASVKLNEAVVDVVGFVGCPVIDGAGGGAVSTTQLYDVGLDALPAASTASTEKVWVPSFRFE
jgi:hypothetical protein